MADPRKSRFPIGLTVATAIGLAILISLGVWQLQRLKWKEGVLAKIAALQSAPAQPLGPVLARAARGEDVEYTRVAVNCPDPGKTQPLVYGYTLREGVTGWRLMTMCHLAGAPYDSILLDRGVIDRFAGTLAPSAGRFPDPVAVTGVLRAVAKAPLQGAATYQEEGDITAVMALDPVSLAYVAQQSETKTPAPYLLAVDRETPAPPGVTPAPLPLNIPNNHRNYALTWFGLAAALAAVYAATLFRGRTSA